MRIGQITHSYYPNVGGIENYIRRLKLFLEKKGYEVNVYTTDWNIKKKVKEKNVFYFKTSLELLGKPVSFEMVKYLKNAQDDIYHFHAPWFLVSLLGERAVGKKPKVMTLHGIQLHGNWKVFLFNTFYFPFAKYLFDRMDAIIAQAENESKILVQRFKVTDDKIKIIPNGIEVEKFHCSKTECKKLVKKYGLTENSFKVLFVSRLVPHKHPDELIKAIRNYLKDENLEVMIIGGGSPNYLNYLKSLAGDDERIHFLGQVDFNELVAAYYTSDVFVFLSTWDAMAAVVLEAMACGLPIITTPTGCVPFVVKEGENGFYVKPEAKDVANKIKSFMELNKSEIKRIGRLNRRKILKHYNWEDRAKDLIKVYEEVSRK